MCHVLMRHFLCDFMALRVIDPISQFIGEVVKKGVGYFQNSGGNWLKGELKNSGVVESGPWMKLCLAAHIYTQAAHINTQTAMLVNFYFIEQISSV